MTRKTYVLEGLCCPNCAAEIDEKVKRLLEVKQASVNFPNTRLTVEFEGAKTPCLKPLPALPGTSMKTSSLRQDRRNLWKRH
jgi:Cd2+/Zn2+-exporting ATPase